MDQALAALKAKYEEEVRKIQRKSSLQRQNLDEGMMPVDEQLMSEMSDRFANFIANSKPSSVAEASCCILG